MLEKEEPEKAREREREKRKKSSTSERMGQLLLLLAPLAKGWILHYPLKQTPGWWVRSASLKVNRLRAQSKSIIVAAEV